MRFSLTGIVSGTLCTCIQTVRHLFRGKESIPMRVVQPTQMRQTVALILPNGSWLRPRRVRGDELGSIVALVGLIVITVVFAVVHQAS